MIARLPRLGRCAHGDMHMTRMVACSGVNMADLQGAQANLGDFQFSRSKVSFGVLCTTQSHLSRRTDEAISCTICSVH